MSTTNRKQRYVMLSTLLALCMYPMAILANTTAMPQGLGEALEKSLHAIEADRKHPGHYSSHNPRQRLNIGFSPQGLQIRPYPNSKSATSAAAPWHWQLSLSSWGSPAQQQRVAFNGIEQRANRIAYQRGALTEWYVNTYRGLEQGFTLNQPPDNATDRVELQFTLTSDLQARWKTEGRALAFYTAKGDYAFSYDNLKAWDADGKVLPATLRRTDQGIALQVETAAARYPLTIDPLVSTEFKLTASDAAGGDQFGWSVAISGDTALVGARFDDDGGFSSGSAYIFVRSGASWTEQHKLMASDAAAGDEFGQSVALSGDTALVGAHKDDDNGSLSGSAYLFVRDSLGDWSQQQKLTASDAAADDQFGWSVALSGDTALVGARLDDDGGSNSGSAYVFVRDGLGDWSQQQKLTASDAAASDQFGYSVALSGEMALVGAPEDNRDAGSAYIFLRDNIGDWIQQIRLTANDAVGGDYFGSSVALSGGTALVGAPRDDSFTGAAYAFVRSGASSIWIQQQKLTASDAEAHDVFGNSVALTGDTALVGALWNDDGGFVDNGSAYVFVRNGPKWTEQQKLTASDTDHSDLFGHSVALSGDTALVGAYSDDDDDSLSGSAYAFYYPCGMGAGLQDQRWTMIGIPCGSAGTLEQVFTNNQNPPGNNLLASDYGIRWVVYQYRAGGVTYQRVELADLLQQNQGYWILSLDGIIWDIGDPDDPDYNVTESLLVQGNGCTSTQGCYEIPVDGSAMAVKALLGNPLPAQVAWKDVRLAFDGKTYTPSEAQMAELMSNTYWTYNGNGYDVFDDSTPGAEGVLNSAEGFWIEVLHGSSGEAMTLLIPAGGVQ